MTGKRHERQRGQETLQAVLAVSFILLPVLFGILEFGGLIHIWIGQSAAAAVGARVAGERGEDDAVVQERITAALHAAGLDRANVKVEVAPAFVHWGQPITVTIESRRRIAIPFVPGIPNIRLVSSYVARGEVNH